MYDNNKNITAEKNNHASRILVKCTNKDYEHQLCDELNSCFDHIYSYISPNWLNISSKENTKLSAIRYLEANNLISNIYTIGNDVNDYDMIKEYNGYIINKNVESMNTIASVSELINKINHI